MNWTVHSFRDRHADAQIVCVHCGRKVIWQPFTLERMFADRPIPVEEMARRFRCRKCHGRGAGIAALIRGRR
jgi:hypothetical protein